MLELLKVLFLGIVEGITEWLPISSTGHMLLVDEIIQLSASEEFKKMFFVVIQLGAILAVCLVYFNRLNPFNPKLSKNKQKSIIRLWILVLIGCIPAGVVGVLFDDAIDAFFYNSTLVIAITLIVYGVLFIVLESHPKPVRVKKTGQLTIKDAALVGAFQMLALIPGTSRSGSTILGGMILGIDRFVAAEYSFFLAIPVMFGASLLKLLKYGFAFSFYEFFILIFGMAVAFVTSLFVIKFLMNYVKKHDFKLFGYYRIVLGIIVIVYFTFLK